MKAAPLAEFVAIAAAMISLVALSIDAMLPALPDIGQEFALSDNNDQQLVITLLFLGLGIGQLVYGPMSDATGRKPAIYTGFFIFFIGTVICLFAPTFYLMLVGRFLQGLGAASPRIVMMAVIRDRFQGTTMAQVMSFIMAVFILIPALAPLMGQGILLLGSWHMIFLVILIYGFVTLTWFALRQPETLAPENRNGLTPRDFLTGIKFIAGEKLTVGAILVMGMVFGGFVGYLGSAQQIFVDHYQTGKAFPFYFAMIALAIGFASIVNSKLVVRYGVNSVSMSALIIQTILSAIMLPIFILVFQNHPPLWLFLTYCLPLFFSLGLQFGNLNALAMKPLGHIAGLGASVCGAVSTTLAVPVGTLVGQAYDGTPVPLTAAFLVFGIVGSLIFYRLCREND
ncbi:multidrug effflux MFS transporter [Ketobacter sp. MCCC 1A13808]|uniref:multidrug effflux MFS transporter n=1 Tax=Ketobacter sp. MCCC 1A13808 TaxID=2602738 RepID=UPI0012EBB1F0|nr:multidrug effflux MFS transporter [Ketobacter sp. MCCC 1A13808]MVF13240.1 multidrug effflux MFS transporter [Ketobacter sp. MCCC 1A13808]